jgi:hypothetical protein
MAEVRPHFIEAIGLELKMELNLVEQKELKGNQHSNRNPNLYTWGGGVKQRLNPTWIVNAQEIR